VSEPLTLAVPYYSGFALFEQTLRSLAAQRGADCRLLVVDDSPLGLGEAERRRVESAAGGVPLRVLRNAENLGMARSWNRCLDDADTDLVTIVHADDLLAPDYAAEMVALAGRFAVPAVFSGARVIDAGGRDLLSVPDLVKRALIPRHQDTLALQGDWALASLLRGNYIFCPSLCYRRSRLGTVRFDPDYRFVLDMDLTVRLLLAGETLVGVPARALYHYRRHADNATERLTAELTRFQEESAFYRQVADRAEALGLRRAARTARGQRIIQLNLAFCIARDLAARKFRAGAEKLRLFRRLFARQRVS
jgi:GT2 family glycosyltransferase